METAISRRGFFGRSLVAAGTLALLGSPMIGLSGCSTSWMTTAENDLPIVVNIATTIVSIVATLTGNGGLTPAAVVIIQEAANVFSAGMSALQDAINAYKSSPTASLLAKVIAAIDAVEADAPKVIATISQVPANVVSIITAGIGTAISLLSAIESLIPKSAVVGTVLATRAQAVKVSMPNAAQVKSNWNAVLVRYGYGQHQMQ